MQKTNNFDKLPSKKPALAAPPKVIQMRLFQVEKQCEIDGVEMGVLENGVPYLSESGLTRMCGIDRKTMYTLANNWPEEKLKARGQKINAMLQESGYSEDRLYLESELDGVKVNAYTEPVCMALLEYYAFDADEPREEARRAYRALAKKSFRTFIYTATGYSPEQRLLDSWKHFHDRVDIVSSAVPVGYFSIFNEIAFMIIPMIRNGIIISDKVIPDISVGLIWAKYWKDNNLDTKHGERIRFNHEYPEYYPQAKSNPQQAYAYPESALGEFREWMRNNYITKNFPKYLIDKVKRDMLSSRVAQRAIAAFAEAPQIEQK